MAQRVQEEQLGDLKLYRVPERTTVASRQAKQVRLFDRRSIPITILYGASLPANQNSALRPAERFLRTRNDRAHGLALPLPSAQVASFVKRGEAALLVGESPLRDTAVDEEFELGLGESPDVQVESVRERRRVGPSTEADVLPRVRGATSLRSSPVDDVNRVEIHNARDGSIHFELKLHLADGTQLIAADHPVGTRNGQPLFQLTMAAGTSQTIHYQTEHTVAVSHGHN